MVNANGRLSRNDQNIDDETFTIELKRHECLFLVESLKAHRRLIRYCLMRIANIDFVDDRLLEERLEKGAEKNYHNIDIYIRKIMKDLDRLLYPHEY